jgi:hypothetical protein
MLVICIDCEGNGHQDEVPPGQIINQHYYWEVLQCVREKVSQKNTHIDGWAGLVASPLPVCWHKLLRQQFLPLKTRL